MQTGGCQGLGVVRKSVDSPSRVMKKFQSSRVVIVLMVAEHSECINKVYTLKWQVLSDMYFITMKNISQNITNGFLTVLLFFIFIFICSSIWLCQDLVAERRTFQLQLMSCQLWHGGSIKSPLTRDRSRAPHIRSVESQPLDHQGNLTMLLFLSLFSISQTSQNSPQGLFPCHHHPLTNNLLQSGFGHHHVSEVPLEHLLTSPVT